MAADLALLARAGGEFFDGYVCHQISSPIRPAAAQNKEIRVRFALACGAAQSVHVTVVDRHGEENTMDTAVLMEIENLRRANLAELRARHWKVFHEPTRSRNREQLFRRIAWRLQALAEGDLSERARARAEEIALDADLRMVAPQGFFTLESERIETVPGDRNLAKEDRRLPIPGTLLKRNWKGRNLLVEVLRKGFRYEGRYYSSLSAIAFEVTGTRWNGLAFFGLTSAGGKPGEGAAS